MMEMEEHAEEYETSLKRVQESLQAYPELEIKILPGSTHTAELPCVSRFQFIWIIV